MTDYEITDVDFFEQDALLVVGGTRYFFQFDKKPNLKSALSYLFHEGKIVIKD